jgi:glucose/arabinose dehydrogenase
VNTQPIRLAIRLIIILAVLAGFPALAAAQSAPSVIPTLTLSPLNAPGLSNPTYLTGAGDGSGRLFIVEQPGRIRIYKNGALLPAAFLNIVGRVQLSSEEGLLSVAFPPNFAAVRRFYVYYTMKDGNNVLSRFNLGASADQADPNSEVKLLTFLHPTNANHNGGQLQFGSDGYLYIGTGDGGSGGDPPNNAQNKNVLLGKLLRIDVEMTPRLSQTHSLYFPMTHGPAVQTIPKLYHVPLDNPFVGQANVRPEIWAYGLRNPWRFSFDRSSHDLYIGDVGQNAWEEIDYQPAASPGGQNYGWRVLEGMHCYPSGTCTNPPAYAPPAVEYNHGTNDSIGCAVTGGFVYRGSAYPALQGLYFYADYCTGTIWDLQFISGAWQTNPLTVTNPVTSITSFGQDDSGELYLLTGGGGVYRVTNP